MLAGFAAGAWISLEQLGARGPAWLARALARVHEGSRPIKFEPSVTLAVGLLLALGVTAGVAVLLLAGRHRDRRRLDVAPDIGEIPPWLGIVTCVVALTVLIPWLRPALAGAARGVDVADPAGLWIVWTRWLGEGLLAVAVVALCVGVIERLASARRLWQGLHLTRAQARERARAAGDRR